MQLLNLSIAYLWWHYTLAWSDLWRLYTNLSWFLFNFFSVKLLFGTLFAPWKRLHERATRRGEGGAVGRIIINFITRLVGFFLRTITIFLGLASLFALFVLALVFFTLWLVLPLVALLSVLFGLASLLALVLTG